MYVCLPVCPRLSFVILVADFHQSSQRISCLIEDTERQILPDKVGSSKALGHSKLNIVQNKLSWKVRSVRPRMNSFSTSASAVLHRRFIEWFNPAS